MAPLPLRVALPLAFLTQGSYALDDGNRAAIGHGLRRRYDPTNDRYREKAMTPFGRLCALAGCAALILAQAQRASSEEYTGYRRIGAWNLARKTSASGHRIEMMAVAAKETESDFFLIMCSPSSANLYISIVTKETSLTKDEPLLLKARFSFDSGTSEFQMRKVLVDDQAVLRDDTKVDVAALTDAMSKSRSMGLEAEGFKRSYDIGGFADAFGIVDSACRGTAEP